MVITGETLPTTLYVTVMTAVPELPAESRAVTVTMLTPAWRTIPDADHDVVPMAVPLPPRLFVHVTWLIPAVDEAVPLKVSEFELVA